MGVHIDRCISTLHKLSPKRDVRFCPIKKLVFVPVDSALSGVTASIAQQSEIQPLVFSRSNHFR